MAMSEFGAFLQRQREERQLSLDEIEEITRIRRKYLEAMEAGDWDRLPPGVYTRGLVKSYARAHGLSTASALRMYAKERPSEARLPEPQLISQPLIRETRFSYEGILTAVVLVMALSLFAWIVRNQIDLPAIGPGGSVAEVIATPTSGTTTLDGLADGTPVPAAPTRDGAATARALASATPTGTPTPPTGLRFQIDVDSDVWLELQVDDGERVQGFLRPGDQATQVVDAEGYVYLKTGNAGAMTVTINGRDVGSLGEAGEVKVYEWRLLPDGAVEQQVLR
jgi:cytoskeleton protein RodZ